MCGPGDGTAGTAGTVPVWWVPTVPVAQLKVAAQGGRDSIGTVLKPGGFQSASKFIRYLG